MTIINGVKLSLRDVKEIDAAFAFEAMEDQPTPLFDVTALKIDAAIRRFVPIGRYQAPLLSAKDKSAALRKHIEDGRFIGVRHNDGAAYGQTGVRTHSVQPLRLRKHTGFLHPETMPLGAFAGLYQGVTSRTKSNFLIAFERNKHPVTAPLTHTSLQARAVLLLSPLEAVASWAAVTLAQALGANGAAVVNARRNLETGLYWHGVGFHALQHGVQEEFYPMTRDAPHRNYREKSAVTVPQPR